MTGPPRPTPPYPMYHPGDPLVMVPYTMDKLRTETVEALRLWGGPYTLWPLQAADPYAYAKFLAGAWNLGSDLMVIEHDMLPAATDIRELLACGELWCSVRYHVGNDQYVTGLGFCKFSAKLQRDLPLAAQHAAVHPAKAAGLMPWQGLNEAIERAISRRGVLIHVHPGVIEHLHYPVGDHAG